MVGCWFYGPKKKGRGEAENGGIVKPVSALKWYNGHAGMALKWKMVKKVGAPER